VHLSVQEYFERHVWTMSHVHAHIAKSYLHLLIADELPSTSTEHLTEMSATRLKKGQSKTVIHDPWFRDLLDYATWKWFRYIREHGYDDIDEELARVLKLFLGSMDKSSMAFQTWYKLLRLWHRPLASHIRLSNSMP
jgi:hypothetical protein